MQSVEDGRSKGFFASEDRKIVMFIAFCVCASMSVVAAYARDAGGLVAPELSRPTPGHLLNQDYLTSTGATVPRPGVPQSSGGTSFDRYIQQENNRIDNSICSGC